MKRLVLVALTLGLALPAAAVCTSVSPQISTIGFPPLGYSYIYTPGLCDSGPPCPNGSGVGFDSTGDFWVLGAGDPVVGQGVDSGGWPMIDGIYPILGWNYTYPGYPAFIESGWSLDPRIDGCPDDVAPLGSAGLCMGMQMSDEVDGVGYFALLTAENDAVGNFLFAQPGGSPIVLGEIPRPEIVGLVPPFNDLTVMVAAPEVTDGLYLDAGCDDPLVGYRIYFFETFFGSAPPVDRAIDSGWVDATGDLPLDEHAELRFTCGANLSYYLATQLLFDSGFETDVVSRNSLRVDCGPNYTEIEERPRTRPGTGLSLRRTKRALER